MYIRINSPTLVHTQCSGHGLTGRVSQQGQVSLAHPPTSTATSLGHQIWSDIKNDTTIGIDSASVYLSTNNSKVAFTAYTGLNVSQVPALLALGISEPINTCTNTCWFVGSLEAAGSDSSNTLNFPQPITHPNCNT